MKRVVFLLLILLFSCGQPQKGPRLLADSSGRINAVTIIMPENDWKGQLGQIVRKELEKEYEGLPLMEPQFTLSYMPPKLFNGFAKHSRNILHFSKDSTAKMNLYQNQFAKPQVVSQIQGEDSEVQAFMFEESASLIRRTFVENERKEKRRRMMKSPAKATVFMNTFGIKLTYPTAYKTFKTDTNFVWIQKAIPKGHLNLIAYRVEAPDRNSKGALMTIAIRDSVGKKQIPGRLPNSYMATEAAYRPYRYKTNFNQRETYVTKGVWSAANDYMAGPFVHYIIREGENDEWLALEGFTFAPSVNKREYMFELETIIRSLERK